MWLYSPKSIDILRSLRGRAAKSITCTYVYVHLYHMNSLLKIPETDLLAPMPLTGCGYQTFYLTHTHNLVGISRLDIHIT
jgi:hypothetical protein